MPESTPFCFIHCANLHLDSPFEGIPSLNPGIAAILRDATFRAFHQVIALALRENADFIIVAGDIGYPGNIQGRNPRQAGEPRGDNCTFRILYADRSKHYYWLGANYE
jgi:hypothetical protein